MTNTDGDTGKAWTISRCVRVAAVVIVAAAAVAALALVVPDSDDATPRTARTTTTTTTTTTTVPEWVKAAMESGRFCRPASDAGPGSWVCVPSATQARPSEDQPETTTPTTTRGPRLDDLRRITRRDICDVFRYADESGMNRTFAVGLYADTLAAELSSLYSPADIDAAVREAIAAARC